MHPNPAFRKTAQQTNIEFARARSFGILAVNSDEGPLLSHIPFQLSGDGSELEAHLVRSNPILRLLEQPVPAVMAVSGGDAYVSPDWYGVENQVPTWNYVAVHLRGSLERLAQEKLPGILERLSADLEQRLAPKPPWKIDKMDADAFQKLERQIVPVRMRVTDIQGTWKLSQNKPDEAQTGAQAGIEAAPVGMNTKGIVEWMRSAKS